MGKDGRFHSGFILNARSLRIRRRRLGAKMAEFNELKNLLTIAGGMLGTPPSEASPRTVEITHHKRRSSWAYLKKLREHLPPLRA